MEAKLLLSCVGVLLMMLVNQGKNKYSFIRFLFNSMMDSKDFHSRPLYYVEKNGGVEYFLELSYFLSLLYNYKLHILFYSFFKNSFIYMISYKNDFNFMLKC